MRKLALFVLVAFCLVLLGSSVALAASKKMIVGSVNARDRALSQAFFNFKEYLEAENLGFEVDVFTDGVLGDDRRTIEGLQLGTIHGTTVSTGPIAAFYSGIGVLDLPFLFKDRDEAYAVLDGPVGQELLNALEAEEFIGLCYWENGWRHLTNSKHEVTGLEGIKGLKIRTLESPIHVDIWTSLGANPTPMSFSQLYTALEQKVVDGQENPLANVMTNKMDEVQKFVTLSGHLYGASPFLVSKVWWDSLNDAERAAVKKAALKARDDERKMAEQEDVVALAYLKDHGMTISELAPGEQAKMRAAVQAVYDKYGAAFKENLEKIEAAKP